MVCFVRRVGGAAHRSTLSAARENQRKIAEITMKNQNKQYKDMLEAQEDANMWGAIGDIAGSIDWGSIF